MQYFGQMNYGALSSRRKKEQWALMNNKQTKTMLLSSLKNSILAFALIGLIAGVESLASCTSASPQCCWVVRSWQLMGKSTSVSSTSSTACCSMSGVSCSGSSVTGINWDSKYLTGTIPAELGKLTSLTRL